MAKKTVLKCEVCGRKAMELVLVEGKQACENCKHLLGEFNPFYIMLGKGLDMLEASVMKFDTMMCNLPVIRHAMQHIVGNAAGVMKVMEEVTTHDVRLYVVEGPQLSVRSWPRITWYNSVQTAKEIAEQAGHKGKLVYVDLTLNIFSEYNFRFYSLYKQAYTLHGSLLKHARRAFKYVDKEVI